jgi:hypothetical protein
MSIKQSTPQQPAPRPQQPQQRIAFQETAPTANKKKLDLNINNKQSMTETLPKSQSTVLAEGQKAAAEANDRLNGYADEAARLALAFKNILNDTTLAVNKSVIARDAEKGLIGNLIALGTTMNNDVRQEEGQGSMGVITLLLGTSLNQRDKINELAYADTQHAQRIMALEAQNKMLENQLKALSVQVAQLDNQLKSK